MLVFALVSSALAGAAGIDAAHAPAFRNLAIKTDRRLSVEYPDDWVPEVHPSSGDHLRCTESEEKPEAAPSFAGYVWSHSGDWNVYSGRLIPERVNGLISLERCSEECNLNPSCVAFYYSDYSSSCSLYTGPVDGYDFEDKYYMEGYHAYLKCTHELGVDVCYKQVAMQKDSETCGGTPLEVYAETSLEDCALYCALEPECMNFAVNQKPTCRTYSSCGDAKDTIHTWDVYEMNPCTVAPTPQPTDQPIMIIDQPTSGCQSVSSWADVDGDTCADYDLNGWCEASWQFMYIGHEGKTADEACCECQGGTRYCQLPNGEKVSANPSFLGTIEHQGECLTCLCSTSGVSYCAPATAGCSCHDAEGKPEETPSIAGFAWSHSGIWYASASGKLGVTSLQSCADECNMDSSCVAFHWGFSTFYQGDICMIYGDIDGREKSMDEALSAYTKCTTSSGRRMDGGIADQVVVHSSEYNEAELKHMDEEHLTAFLQELTSRPHAPVDPNAKKPTKTSTDMRRLAGEPFGKPAKLIK